MLAPFAVKLMVPVGTFGEADEALITAFRVTGVSTVGVVVATLNASVVASCVIVTEAVAGVAMMKLPLVSV